MTVKQYKLGSKTLKPQNYQEIEIDSEIILSYTYNSIPSKYCNNIEITKIKENYLT